MSGSFLSVMRQAVSVESPVMGGVALDCCGEEGFEPEGKVFDSPVRL